LLLVNADQCLIESLEKTMGILYYAAELTPTANGIYSITGRQAARSLWRRESPGQAIRSQ
jgi:hypothetical protein